MSSTAVLLMNLGSPEQPETKYLKPYLTEFLMDERVIDKPYWLRTILVKGIIVPFRAAKSAAKYKTIWTKEGSPLIVHSKKQRKLLQERIDYPVYISMRYGHPSTKNVLQQMHAENAGLKNIVVLPLYPHYAMSSYETAVVQIKEEHQRSGYQSSLSIIPPFYHHPSYIHSLSNSIKPYLSQAFDHILFSFHGIPERHIRKKGCDTPIYLPGVDCCAGKKSASFCYRHQVLTTTDLVAKELGLTKEQFSVSFQSRLGRDPWLQPYTDKQLEIFPSKGIRKLLVVCPAFVSDCLETLEEIEEEGKELFLHAGGESFTMIPALNENEDWIDCMEKLVSSQYITPETKKQMVESQ